MEQSEVKKCVLTLMQRAQERGWRNFVLPKLNELVDSQGTAIPLPSTKIELLKAFLDLNNQAVRSLLPPDFELMTWRDRVFEVFLLRIEQLFPYKSLVSELTTSLTCVTEKKLILQDMHHAFSTLLCTELTCSLQKAFLTKVLMGLYGLLVRHWIATPESDLNALMAYLDPLLCQAEDIGEFLSLI